MKSNITEHMVARFVMSSSATELDSKQEYSTQYNSVCAQIKIKLTLLSAHQTEFVNKFNKFLEDQNNTFFRSDKDPEIQEIFISELLDEFNELREKYVFSANQEHIIKYILRIIDFARNNIRSLIPRTDQDNPNVDNSLRFKIALIQIVTNHWAGSAAVKSRLVERASISGSDKICDLLKSLTCGIPGLGFAAHLGVMGAEQLLLNLTLECVHSASVASHLPLVNSAKHIIQVKLNESFSKLVGATVYNVETEISEFRDCFSGSRDANVKIEKIANLIGHRYKEQLDLLSEKGVNVLAQYIADSLIMYWTYTNCALRYKEQTTDFFVNHGIAWLGYGTFHPSPKIQLASNEMLDASSLLRFPGLMCLGKNNEVVTWRMAAYEGNVLAREKGVTWYQSNPDRYKYRWASRVEVAKLKGHLNESSAANRSGPHLKVICDVEITSSDELKAYEPVLLNKFSFTRDLGAVATKCNDIEVKVIQHGLRLNYLGAVIKNGFLDQKLSALTPLEVENPFVPTKSKCTKQQKEMKLTALKTRIEDAATVKQLVDIYNENNKHRCITYHRHSFFDKYRDKILCRADRYTDTQINFIGYLQKRALELLKTDTRGGASDRDIDNLENNIFDSEHKINGVPEKYQNEFMKIPKKSRPQQLI